MEAGASLGPPWGGKATRASAALAQGWRLVLALLCGVWAEIHLRSSRAYGVPTVSQAVQGRGAQRWVSRTLPSPGSVPGG